MKKLQISILIATTALATVTANADYYFAVPREVVEVTVNQDSSIDIEYWTTFANHPDAYAIDVIDVGFPSDDYDIDSVVAEVDGEPVGYITPSTYIETGVEIHPVFPISAGATGTLHLKGRNYRMVYEDSDDERFASVHFGTNYFGSDYCYGEKQLLVRMVFPPGAEPEYVKYHEDTGGVPANSYARPDGRLVYEYQISNAVPWEMYKFGISFPRNLVSEVRKPPGIIESLLGLAVGLVVMIIELIVPFLGCIIPVGIFFFIGLFSSIGKRKRRMKYLPPLAKAEGVGIKRGLTAPEAALLMERPLDKVLTLIMFGLIKKSALSVTSNDPLILKPMPIKKGGLKPYEKAFFKAIDDDGDLKEDDLKTMIVDMIEVLEDKLGGFSYKETVAYYRSIVNTAWKLVTEAGTPEAKMQELTNSMEWTMLDENFDKRSKSAFSGVSYFPVPYWWGYAYPNYSPSTSGGGGIPQISFGEFSRNFVSGVENLASGVVSKVTKFTGKVTSVTNPPPVKSGGSFGGGGSSGCACACACAGCACACAGGGR